MPLHIIRDDITKVPVDAIVNAANTSLLGGGGVDGCIHRAAGPELLAECRTLGGCPTGSAKLTRGYRLPARYVIHAVGPVWQGGDHGEREALASCYTTSLHLALEAGCQTVAFPLISSGIYGYPKDQALRVADEAIGAFLAHHDMTVYLVIFDKGAYSIGQARYHHIQAYIDDHYVQDHTEPEAVRQARPVPQAVTAKAPPPAPKKGLFRRDKTPRSSPKSLDEALNTLDESFSQTLLRKIDEKGMTDAACYKKANISRKLFSKIRGDRDYRPSKNTVLCFAIALELSWEETDDFLRRAGFALSQSSKFDVIVGYFIRQGNYNIFEINEALFAFDQSLLG